VREPSPKYVVNDVEVSIVSERVQYLDANGKLISESLKDYTRKAVRKAYASLTAFLNAWNDADRKQAIIDELADHGVFLDELAEQVGRDIDAFDLICHIAFDQPQRTRRERADKVRKRNVFGKYGEKTRAVLEALLDKYADSGLKSVESLEILKVDPLTQFGTPVEIVHLFGGKQNYLAAIQELETQIYREAA
jgi:type I restriction enzyme R subunit